MVPTLKGAVHKNMKTGYRFLTGFALVAMTCGLASADTIITTDATVVGPSLTDFDWTLLFPATAAPAGMNLVSVTLEVDATISDPTLTLVNNATTPQTFTFNATTDVDVNTNSVDGTLVGDSLGPSTVLNVHTTLAGGASNAYGPLTLTETAGPAAVSNLAGYLAGLTLTGDTMSGTSFVGGGGNIMAIQVQDATINGEIVFDFASPVTTPEPTTMVLFGSALVGLGLLRRRTSRR